MATVSYPLDLDGNAPSNLVQNELQVLIAQNDTPYRFFVPTFAPFYLTNLKIEGTSQTGTRVELKDGIDFYCSLIYKGATASTGKPVYGGITIVTRSVNGPFYMTYQTLGGKYAADRQFVVNTIAENNFNPRKIAWDQVTNIQETFPPSPHPQDLDTFTGLIDLIGAVGGVRDAILQTPGPDSIIWKHILDFDDPHKTMSKIPPLGDFATKEDVANAIINHVAQDDPHTQYLKKDDYEPGGGGGGGEIDPAKVKQIVDKAIADHEAKQDPHPQYITRAEADANYLTEEKADDLYMKKGNLPPASEDEAGMVKFANIQEHLAGSIANKAATPAGVKAIMDKHLADLDPHPQYLTEAKAKDKFYTKEEADAKYVDKDKLETDFPTREELERDFLKKTDAEQKYLTPSAGDQRYLTKEKADQTYIPQTKLPDLLTKAEAESLYGPNGTNAYRPPDASTTVKGIVRLATAQEAKDGLSNSIAVTPSGQKEAMKTYVDNALANSGANSGGLGDPALRLFFSIYS